MSIKIQQQNKPKDEVVLHTSKLYFQPNMRDTVNSQYNSFLFWRMPIPEVDLADLKCLGLADMSAYDKPTGGYGGLGTSWKKQNRAVPDGEDDSEDDLLQFNSFNFWRAPIATINPLDFDLI
uniref:Protein AF1q n=1 Tax=Salvator merianae TaxID=96440 RepID=A0A8D0E6L8_SALMN